MRVQKGDRILATATSHILIHKEEMKKLSLSNLHQIKRMSVESAEEFVARICRGD